MERKKNQTKKKIVSAAWRLFYEQGYENTTVDDIVELSGTSKGSFYHYFTQLVTRGEKHLLDHNRVYYRLLRSIVLEGQERGQINREIPAAEITKLYALCERALLYDWCICSGEYSLTLYSQKMMPLFLAEARAQ